MAWAAGATVAAISARCKFIARCGVAEKARIGRDLFRSEDDPPAAKASNPIAQFALDFARKESVCGDHGRRA
jgi:hypothetical protein